MFLQMYHVAIGGLCRSLYSAYLYTHEVERTQEKQHGQQKYNCNINTNNLKNKHRLFTTFTFIFAYHTRTAILQKTINKMDHNCHKESRKFMS